MDDEVLHDVGFAVGGVVAHVEFEGVVEVGVAGDVDGDDFISNLNFKCSPWNREKGKKEKPMDFMGNLISFLPYSIRYSALT